MHAVAGAKQRHRFVHHARPHPVRVHVARLLQPAGPAVCRDRLAMRPKAGSRLVVPAMEGRSADHIQVPHLLREIGLEHVRHEVAMPAQQAVGQGLGQGMHTRQSLDQSTHHPGPGGVMHEAAARQSPQAVARAWCAATRRSMRSVGAMRAACCPGEVQAEQPDGTWFALIATSLACRPCCAAHLPWASLAAFA
jgi:hypothetical protein